MVIGDTQGVLVAQELLCGPEVQSRSLCWPCHQCCRQQLCLCGFPVPLLHLLHLTQLKSEALRSPRAAKVHRGLMVTSLGVSHGARPAVGRDFAALLRNRAGTTVLAQDLSCSPVSLVTERASACAGGSEGGQFSCCPKPHEFPACCLQIAPHQPLGS